MFCFIRLRLITSSQSSRDLHHQFSPGCRSSFLTPGRGGREQKGSTQSTNPPPAQASATPGPRKVGLLTQALLQKSSHTCCRMVIHSVRLIKQVLVPLKPRAYLLPGSHKAFMAVWVLTNTGVIRNQFPLSLMNNGLFSVTHRENQKPVYVRQPPRAPAEHAPGFYHTAACLTEATTRKPAFPCSEHRDPSPKQPRATRSVE